MTKFNRRNILKAGVLGGSGLAALAYSPKPTLAASEWDANSPSKVSNDNGELSSLEIPASGFSFSLDYSGLGSGSHSIEFKLEAKLSSASSFETVFSDSFEVTGDSGTASESKLSTSFPIDLLANTSMSASDFAEPNAGETNSTVVDLKISFNWTDSKFSASDSVTESFVVDVARQADPSFTWKSLTIKDPPKFSNYDGKISSLEIPKDDFSFSLDYDGFESGTHSVDFELEAKLASSSSYDSVFSESFDIEGESGFMSDSQLSTSFPIDLLSRTSMTASDFEEPTGGKTEDTAVDMRVSFNWSDSEYSASESTVTGYDVTVEHIADPSLSMNEFSVNDPPTVKNDNGEISSLELPKDDFSFSLDYVNFKSGTHSINFELEAKLGSASSYDTVFTESFNINGDTDGTVNESELSTSFPVDLLANTSMSASDFEEPNAGEVESTPVDFRVSFNWSDSEFSTSASSMDSFIVTVENTSPTYSITNGDFETGDLSGWSHDAGASVANSPVYSGSYSFEWTAQGRSSSWASQVIAEDGLQPESISFYFYETSNSTGHGVRLTNSNNNYECGAGTNNPNWMISTGGDPFTFDSSVSNYSMWVKTLIEFDWTTGEVRFTFTRQDTGYSNQSSWLSMGEGADISAIEFWPQHKSTWGQGNNNKQSWIDLVEMSNP